MRIIPIALPLLCLYLIGCSDEPTLEPILNGETLEGWRFERELCWEVKEGVLFGKNDPEKKGDILFSEKQDYRDFVLELEFKLGEGRVDSGVFLRDSKEQIQIGESGSLKRDMTALPYIPSMRGYPVQVDTAEKVFDKADWNRLRIKVVGASYTTWLNGEEIMTYDSETIVEEGPVGLQVHPHREMEILFRNIRLAEL